MSVRITIAMILIVFMIPVGHIYFSLPVAGIDSVEEQEAVRLFGFLGYVILMVYLIVTGYNLKNNGTPW